MTLPYDPWTTVTTRHGMAADEAISVLQKAIRRGQLEEAVLVAYEMYCTSPEMEAVLWSRLQVISVEDVNGGTFNEPAIVNALFQMHERVERSAGDRFLYAVHAVRLLVTSQKDRTTDEMANWARRTIEGGERMPAVPDHVLDMHTRRGQEMGRGELHFLSECALVENEVPGRDQTWRHWLLERLEKEARG